MAAKNRVISGEYKGEVVIKVFMEDKIRVGDFDSNIFIDKTTVEEYQLITEENRKSGTSAILRGAAGAAILGPVGLLAGLSAKTEGINTVAILWKNGKRSLIEVDNKIYKKIVECMF